MMKRSKSYFKVKNQTNQNQIIKNILPSKEYAKNNNYVNLVESSYGSNQKVELTIVAGCSGSGKSTLMNMHRDKLTQIDSEEKIILKRTLPVNAISELNKLEIHMNNLCQDRYHRALTLGGYFDYADLTSLFKENIIPTRMLMHIDLRHLLLCLKGSPLNPRKSIDLINKNENDMIMRKILKNLFFQNCKSIKLLTLWIDYKKNKIRFYERSKVKKFFQLRDIASNYVHSELYNCWFRNLHFLNPSSDHLITEIDGNYSVSPRRQI